MTDENNEERKQKILKLSERVRKMMSAAVMLSTAPLIGHNADDNTCCEYKPADKKDYFLKPKNLVAEKAFLTAETASNPAADKYEAHCGEYKIIQFPKDKTEETETTEK